MMFGCALHSAFICKVPRKQYTEDVYKWWKWYARFQQLIRLCVTINFMYKSQWILLNWTWYTKLSHSYYLYINYMRWILYHAEKQMFSYHTFIHSYTHGFLLNIICIRVLSCINYVYHGHGELQIYYWGDSFRRKKNNKTKSRVFTKHFD